MYEEKPQKLTTKHATHLWRQFHGRNSPVVAHPKLKTSTIIFVSRAIVWFVYNLHTWYSFPVMPAETERKMDKIEIFAFGFLNLLKR